MALNNSKEQPLKVYKYCFSDHSFNVDNFNMTPNSFLKFGWYGNAHRNKCWEDPGSHTKAISLYHPPWRRAPISESWEAGTLQTPLPTSPALTLSLCLANLNQVCQQEKQLWATFLLVFITTILKHSLIINLDGFSSNFLVLKKMNNSSLQL